MSNEWSLSGAMMSAASKRANEAVEKGLMKESTDYEFHQEEVDWKETARYLLLKYFGKSPRN